MKINYTCSVAENCVIIFMPKANVPIYFPFKLCSPDFGYGMFNFFLFYRLLQIDLGLRNKNLK